MDDLSVTATRDQAAIWAEQLGMPKRVLSMTSTPGVFCKACVETTVVYDGPGGFAREAIASPFGRRNELITYEVRRDSQRLAHVKYWAARRTANGQVTGSARVTTNIASTLDRYDARGVQMWIEQFSAAFAQHQVAPAKVLRRIALTCLLDAGTPIVGRKWLYFTYVDHLLLVNRLRDFLSLVCDSADVTVLPIEKGADLRTFIESADADMTDRITDFNQRVHTHEAGRRLTRGSELFQNISGTYRALNARVLDHESRLSARLPASQSLLGQARTYLQAADPTGTLLAACTQG